MNLLCMIGILALAVGVNAKTAPVRAVDATGAPFPNVLIIVKSLDGGGEVGRYLTASDGFTPRIQFGSGLYRVIAVCPYGVCRTSVHEVFGNAVPSELIIPVAVNSTDLNGQIVGGTYLHLMLKSARGKTSGLRILVRDPEARWERWYVSDADGGSEIELPTDPSVIVVLDNGKVFTREASISMQGDRRSKPFVFTLE